MRFRRCADRGLLIDLDGLHAVQTLYAALAADPPAGVMDMVPAARTLLLRLDPDDADPAAVERAVRATEPVESARADAGLLRIPVVYDGADLEEVARLTDRTTADVIEAHVSTEWFVAFGGFAPGFGYLAADDPPWTVPRRTEARTRVPVGSVALADEFSGVYPTPSPGGWQLIGHTELPMWQVDRDPPALLRPGVRVRFEVAR